MTLEKDVLDTLLLLKRDRTDRGDKSSTTDLIRKGYEISHMDSRKKNYFANVLMSISDCFPLLDEEMLHSLSVLIHCSKFLEEQKAFITKNYIRHLGPADNPVLPQGPERANLLLLILSGNAEDLGKDRLKQEKYFKKYYPAYIDAMIELDWKEAESFMLGRIKRGKQNGILLGVGTAYSMGKITEKDYLRFYKKLERLVPEYISPEDFTIIPAPGSPKLIDRIVNSRVPIDPDQCFIPQD